MTSVLAPDGPVPIRTSQTQRDLETQPQQGLEVELGFEIEVERCWGLGLWVWG